MLSGVMCRDQACLIFKIIENRKLGVEIYMPFSNRKIHRMEIVFADDTDMDSNEEMSAECMQMIMGICTRLHEAVGSKM